MGTWYLQERHVVFDGEPSRQLYVRALIDVGSYEFMSCALSAEAKLAIVESVGVHDVLAVMAQVAQEKGRCYRIAIEGAHDLEILTLLARRQRR